MKRIDIDQLMVRVRPGEPLRVAVERALARTLGDARLARRAARVIVRESRQLLDTPAPQPPNRGSRE